MAFAGYLIKLGGSSGAELPMTYMKPESYVAEPNQRMESEAARAVTGLLHRTTVSHTATKIEFETPVLTNKEVVALNTLLTNNMTDTHRKDIKVYYYDNETDSYKTVDCYMPDVKYTINRIEGNTIYYNPLRYAFIEY